MLGAVAGPPCQTTTARPSGAIATAGEVPRPRVIGPDQFTPSLLVQADTLKASRPLPVCAYAAMTQAPAAFKARLGVPDGVERQPTGGWTGVDHWDARAGAAMTPTPSMTIRVVTEEPILFQRRCMMTSRWDLIEYLDVGRIPTHLQTDWGICSISTCGTRGVPLCSPGRLVQVAVHN